jgi:hypothetical protein
MVHWPVIDDVHVTGMLPRSDVDGVHVTGICHRSDKVDVHNDVGVHGPALCIGLSSSMSAMMS